MNAALICENFLAAETQLAEQEGNLGEIAEQFVGLPEATVSFLPLVNQLVEDGGLPPFPFMPVDGEDVAAGVIRGILIALRAVQLTELDSLESIPVITDPV